VCGADLLQARAFAFMHTVQLFAVLWDRSSTLLAKHWLLWRTGQIGRFTTE
jgi:hypothetical protein